MPRTNLARMMLSLSVLILSSMVWAGCTGPDLTVTNIEVTQAIQTTTNSIQLVAQRSTTVRATIGVSGASVPISNVTGQLHVFVDGTEITPIAGVAPINTPFTAQLAPQRANENDTLNFELLAPSGINLSSNVTFRVDITPVSGEFNVGNNSLITGSLSFINRTTPSLFYTRINYTPSGLGFPDATLVAPGVGDMFVRAILPVNDGDPNLYRQGLFPTLTYSEDANSDGQLDALGSDGNDLLALLASCRQLIVNGGLGASDNTFLYGWLAGNPIDGNGLAQVTGRNAFGNTELIRGQRTYAHELTHNFGLSHNTRNLDEVGWDTGERLANNWAGNNVTGRVKPTTLSDIQVAGLLTNQAFVDTTTYNFLLGSSVLAYDKNINPGSITIALSSQVEQPRERVAVIQGIFDRSGEKLIRLEPVFRFPWVSQPVALETGRFVAEVTDDAGNVTRVPFDGLVADDPDKEPEQEVTGFFEVMVAVDPNAELVSLRITDREGVQEFGGFERSEPPTIRILAPDNGAQLGEQTEIRWELEDPDTPLDQLLLQFAYSPNNGKDWVPIAVDVQGTEQEISFDSTQIQKSEREALIRVFVSDGLNTTFADVTELTPLAAIY